MRILFYVFINIAKFFKKKKKKHLIHTHSQMHKNLIKHKHTHTQNKILKEKLIEYLL